MKADNFLRYVLLHSTSGDPNIMVRRIMRTSSSDSDVVTGLKIWRQIAVTYAGSAQTRVVALLKQIMTPTEWNPGSNSKGKGKSKKSKDNQRAKVLIRIRIKKKGKGMSKGQSKEKKIKRERSMDHMVRSTLVMESRSRWKRKRAKVNKYALIVVVKVTQ